MLLGITGRACSLATCSSVCWEWRSRERQSLYTIPVHPIPRTHTHNLNTRRFASGVHEKSDSLCSLNCQKLEGYIPPRYMYILSSTLGVPSFQFSPIDLMQSTTLHTLQEGSYQWCKSVPRYLDANVHGREARERDFVGGNLPQNDSKTVHVCRPLVNVLRPMLQSWRNKRCMMTIHCRGRRQLITSTTYMYMYMLKIFKRRITWQPFSMKNELPQLQV